jgi:hypothetical protein
VRGQVFPTIPPIGEFRQGRTVKTTREYRGKLRT